jgi:flagellar basal body-associated protein FliL
MNIMKTFKLDNEPKIQTGFTVPENYFEDFSAKMMQQLPVNEPKIISIFARKKTWMCAAAAVMVLALSLPIYTNYFRNSSEIDSATLENYITYQSTVSATDLVNLLDEQDIQKISLDLDIEDVAIENELSENKNLEQYLLN